VDVRARFLENRRAADTDFFNIVLNVFTDEKYKLIMDNANCDNKVNKADKSIILQIPSNGSLLKYIIFMLN